MRVGLVAEGTHDFLMLSPLVEAEIKLRFNEEVEFVELQPEQDATGTYSDGGWARVLAWCTLHSGPAINTFLEPLFGNEPQCDVIIIHLDGDALEPCMPHTSIVVPPGPYSVSDRVDLMVEIIENWLSVSAAIRGRLALAIPVMQTEAWIIASVPADPGNSEACDAKATFRANYAGPQSGPLRDFYRAGGISCVGGRDRVLQRCASYDRFVGEISSLRRP